LPRFGFSADPQFTQLLKEYLPSFRVREGKAAKGRRRARTALKMLAPGEPIVAKDSLTNEISNR